MINRNFFFILLILPLRPVLADNEQLNLRTGEHRSIQIPDATNIFISRKGLVTLTHDQGDRWMLSALRSGFVKIIASQQNGRNKIFLVNINRTLPLIRRPKSAEIVDSPTTNELCSREAQAITYVLRASIEMIDHGKHTNFGFEHNTNVSISRGLFELALDVEGNPNTRIHRRQIIANPMVLARACHDVFLRAGGEDEVTQLTDSGKTISAWKSHGLDLRLKITPEPDRTVKLSFTSTLRSPSKGHGNYAINDVQSVVDVPMGEETLVAAINLSSVLTSQKSQLWLTMIPIIGPLFSQRDDASAHTTLLLWFRINQKSVDRAAP